MKTKVLTIISVLLLVLGGIMLTGADGGKIGSTAQLWVKKGTSIFYTAGNVGIGITLPATRLHLKGGIARVGVLSYSELDSTTVRAKAVTLTTTDTTSVGYAAGSIQMRITASDTSVWCLIRTTGSIAARWKKLTP